MSKAIKWAHYVGDFETTVFEEQEYTEVWASAVVAFGSEDVKILGSLPDTLDYLKSLKQNIMIYYHNLKFDGYFILDYLLRNKKYKQGYTGNGQGIEWKKDSQLKANEYKYLISDKMGQWYTITINLGGHLIRFVDSLKLLPFTVEKIGKDFKTKHKKLSMKYEGYRFAGCYISPEEQEYIKNDVLVVKEALEFMYEQGHDKLTIGSCCLSEYKAQYHRIVYEELFPDLTQIEIDKTIYGTYTADEYIRRSYRGGWCYLKRGCENTEYNTGCVADVNSLYPSMMSGESGNYYPVGKPYFWSGNYIPNNLGGDDTYYFIRIRCRFYLKPNHLPFIQIKHNLLYRPNECLETSDVYSERTKQYHKYLRDGEEIIPTQVELTLTQTDFILLQEHYYLEDLTILDGCYFQTEKGIFDDYINKYKQIKLTSKGSMRALAKLMLNNLYGKMASGTDSDFKVGYINEEKDVISFNTVFADDKKAGYIPIGSAITSYSRNFTIRAAQANYNNFIYADTDSIHCVCKPSDIKGIKIDDNAFCCWKIEAEFDRAIYVRQKTYIEHVIAEDCKPIEFPYYNIKCAGMQNRCKELLIKSMTGFKNDEEKEAFLQDKDEQEREFVLTPRTIKDFKVGLVVPSKLRPRRIRGGIVLEKTTYKLLERK